MGYIDPATVLSPKGRVSDVQVLFDKGPSDGSWSIARLKWEGRESVGIRWNGEVNDPGRGTPQAFGNPTWFIIPEEIEEQILRAARELGESKHEVLLSGYREMAADTDREKEAEEWSEGLLMDAYEAR